MSEGSIYNVPNALSAVRIVSIPLLIVLCNLEWSLAGMAAAIVFALASVTDFLDGFLARKLGRITTLGRFLDPVADKLLVSAALIMLIPMGRAEAWIVYVIISREIAVTGLRAAAAASAQRLVIDAGLWGKLKTICQMIAILGLLINQPLWGVNFGLIGVVALDGALALTIISGYLYFKDYWKVISQSGEPRKEDSAPS